MTATFRPRRSILVCGLLCAALFLLVTVGYAALLFIDNARAANLGFNGKPHAAALGYLGTALFGSMFVISVLMCVSYFVERVTIDSTTIIVKSLTQHKRFDISSIRELIWKHRSKGGKLVVRTTISKAVVAMDAYSLHDRLQIVRLFRKLIPVEMQTGWSEFCHFVAVPLRDGRPQRWPGCPQIDPMSLPEKSRVYVTRRRYDWFFAVVFLLGLVGSLVAWQNLGNPRAVIVLPIIVFVWALLRFNTPKEGEWEIKWMGTKTHALVGIGVLALPVMIVIMLACGFVGINPMFPMIAGAVFVAIICFIAMRDASKRERAQRLEDAMQMASSAERWEIMERNSRISRSTTVT